MFVIFAVSLKTPPSIIERIARLQEPDLPESGVSYTRKVTKLWLCFFAFNGTAAAITLGLSKEIWVLYNGLIAYVLMGLLLLGEWLYRRKVKGV